MVLGPSTVDVSRGAVPGEGLFRAWAEELVLLASPAGGTTLLFSTGSRTPVLVALFKGPSEGPPRKGLKNERVLTLNDSPSDAVVCLLMFAVVCLLVNAIDVRLWPLLVPEDAVPPRALP